MPLMSPNGPIERASTSCRVTAKPTWSRREMTRKWRRRSSGTTGRLVIELRAMPAKGATSQFFWANPARGFNGLMQSQRPLTATEQVNTYLFSIPGDSPVKKFPFDPFATYDKYADEGEMMIESIAIYRLGE